MTVGESHLENHALLVVSESVTAFPFKTFEAKMIKAEHQAAHTIIIG